ncbi:MAG: hypothetical protein NTV70_08860 [Acidobacteria bacterium]|nr:hypothetical protein [Acidobacteriota bacterium]
MKFYPQLVTGATVQFPLTATNSARTVENELADGRRVQWSDASERLSRWVCTYQELLPSEWAALRQLFDECEGRLEEFVFPDPMGNLLVWSEDFSRAEWMKSGVNLQGAVAGPLGGTTGTRVVATGSVTGELVQAVALPGWYSTTFSVWVRSEAAGVMELVRRSGAVSQTVSVRTGANWKRVSLSGTTAGGPEPNQFGLAVPAGGAIEVFGAQLEAQPAASAYKKTSAMSGLYLGARFDADELRPTMTAVDRVRVAVPMVARRGV